MPPDIETETPRPVPLAEYGLLLLLSTLWGAAFTFTKMSVATIPPLTTIAWRTALAGGLIYLVMRWQGLRLPADLQTWRSMAAVAAVNTVAPFILIAWGLQWIDAGLGIILNSTTPIFAFLITWALTRQEAITRRKLAGVALGIAGIVLIVGTSALAGLGDQLVPQLAVVLAALSYSVSAIYGRTFRGMSPLAPACGSLLIGSAVLTPLALAIERPWTASPSWSSIVALVLLGVVCTAFGNVLYFRLLGTLGALGTTAQSYLRVPIGVLIGALLLGERLSWSGAIGLVCVVLGVVAMTVPSTRMLPLPWTAIDRAGGLARAGLARVGLARVGLARVGLARVGLARVGLERARATIASPAGFEYMLLLLLAVVWAGSYIWVKLALDTIPPLTLMAGRLVVAALFMAPFLCFGGRAWPRDLGTWRTLAVQSLLANVLPFTLVAWGQQWVDAGPAAILNSVSPLFAFLITWGVTRHEPATALKLAGVAAGLAGVAIVMGPGAWSGLGGGLLLPQLAIVLSSLCYAIAVIWARHLNRIDPVVSAAGAMVTGAAMLLPLAVLVEQPWAIAPSASSLGAMLALGVISTGLGFTLYFRLVRTIGPMGVTAQSYLRAPIGVALGAGLLGEAVSGSMLVGLVLVVIGVAAMTWREGGGGARR